MSLSLPEYIRHMLDEIDYLQSRISNTDHDTFLEDETLKRAFVRSIEIIGEASKSCRALCPPFGQTKKRRL